MLLYAKRGNDIIAIGEFLNAAELWLDNHPEDVEVNVEIGLFYKTGSAKELLEHLHVDARINTEEVVLSTLWRTYTKEVGSDHHGEVLVHLDRSKRFDEIGLYKWINLLDDVEAGEFISLSVSRDHV
jgi:hypothetical protein